MIYHELNVLRKNTALDIKRCFNTRNAKTYDFYVINFSKNIKELWICPSSKIIGIKMQNSSK